MEARKASVPQGDKVILKRTTRRKNKQSSAKQAKKNQSTTHTVIKN